MASIRPEQHTAAETIVAGGAAGGVESLITLPTENIKAQQQLLKVPRGQKISPITLLLNSVCQKGIRQLYGGATAFCIANASKSGVRFFAFDFVQQHFSCSAQGKPSSISHTFSGLAAGVAESLVVVTPGETLKTKLIDDRNRPGGPQYNGTLSAIRHIVATEGLPGL